MTQQPEKQSSSSPEKRFVQRSLAAVARWSPLGGTSFAFASFLLKQEWVTALALFPVTAVSGVWAAYSKNFTERLSEIYGERGKKDAEVFVENMDQANQFLTEKLDWRSLGFTEKYLKCQEWDCHEDNVVGMREEDDLPVNSPLLREVFVPLELSADSLTRGYEFRDRHEATDQLQIWQLLERVREDNRLRQIAIRAWGGYGKTTLLKHLAYVYSRQEYCKGSYRKYKVPTLIPFLLFLGGCWQEITKDDAPNLPELLTDYHIGRLTKIKPLDSVPNNWALNILKRGDALVMFDGFDEAPPVERAKVSTWLSDEMRQYPESVFILTSRPTAYSEDYKARRPTASFWIQDFNPEQRQQFVEQWYICQERYARGGRNTPDVEAKAKEKAEKLLAQIDARPELKDLAGNALLLNMMARFHRDNKQGAELPQRKVELYQDICELQLGRRASARSIFLVLNSISQRQEVLQFVALEMMCGRAKTIDANDFALEYFEIEGFKQIPEADLLEYIEIALQRIDPDVSAKEFLKQAEDISELLVKKDGHTYAVYQFAHLSFQEFLAACELLRSRQQGEKLVFQCLGISAWQDVILFYAAMVNPTKLIQEALNQKHTDLAYRIYKQTEKRLNLSIAEQKALEGVKQSVTESRYQQLEKYLKATEWEKADRETYRLMITAVGKYEGQGFSDDDLRNFPCDELLAIDNLWVKHSNGLYGFSIQKEIYVNCGGKLDFSLPYSLVWGRFCEVTAWQEEVEYVAIYYRTKRRWVDYPDQFFQKDFMMRTGHLPRWKWVRMDGMGILNLRWVLFFSRIKTCEL
jgi:predicted NACHT family NTPase